MPCGAIVWKIAAKSSENVVYNHLLFRGYQVQVGNLGSLEIDFVAQRGGEKLYVQMALSINEPQTMEREFGNLKKIGDNFPKMVVTLDAFQGNTDEGIIATDLRSFSFDVPVTSRELVESGIEQLYILQLFNDLIV